MNTKQLILILAGASLIGGTLPGYAGNRPQHDRNHQNGGHHGDHQVVFERKSDRRFQRYLDTRQRRQTARIEQGLDTRELTRKKAKRLQRLQHKIARLEHDFSSDGHYSKRERQVLQHKLDLAGDAIYRIKHNDISRPQGYAVEDWAPHRSFTWDYGRHDRMGHVWEDSNTRLINR